MIPESSAGFREARISGVDRMTVEAARWLAGGLVGVLSLVATVLLWRRLAGALESPLSVPVLIAVALAVAGVALAVRLLAQLSAESFAPTWGCRLLVWAPLVILCVIGAGLSLPGTSPTGATAFWLILVAEELWSLRGVGRRSSGFKATAQATPTPPGQLRYDAPQTSPPQPISMMFAAEEICPDDVVQQLTRSRGADGSDVLSGWLRVEMAPGQRSASLHVAFCPPFDRTPRLAIEQLSGPRARVKTVQLLPYGSRFDLKLDRPAEEAAAVMLRFLARSSPATGRTAESEDGISPP